ncbi:thioredoxin family protein [Brevibacillus migulae]|uniref:thioredoxin family protein n=1 Tax=Brevibacillus migulae TaxID=1644114 RepID=UPI00106EFA14|nr:thioredoxin family protein [Brevibacillus migulae]
MQELNENEIRNLQQQKATVALFLYTPLCGTCKVAERMLHISEQLLPDLRLIKLNVNRAPAFAQEHQITSVPCVLRMEKGVFTDRLYALRSIEHLLQFLRAGS